MNIIKNSSKVMRWTVAVLFCVMAMVSLSDFAWLSAFFFALGGAVVVPVKAIINLRGMLKLNKTLSVTLAVVCFFAGALTFPSDGASSVTDCSHPNTTLKNKTSATCTVAGYTGDTYCNSCQKTIATGSVISAKGHTTEIRNKKEPTTTSEGYTGDTYCKTCGFKIKSGESIPKKEDNGAGEVKPCSHANTTVKNKASATCTVAGYTGDTYCNSCQKIIATGSSISAKGHTTEIRNKKEPTTTSEGYTGDTYCKTCGIKVKSGESIPKIKDDTQHDQTSQTVYITKTGKKYHSRRSCPGLNNASQVYEVTEEEAEDKNLTPCSRCH